MIDAACELARESLAELALGTLRGGELRQVTAHLEHCKDCRREVTGMLPVATQLLELIPGTEPPLGFDRRVLSQVGEADAKQRWLSRHRTIATGIAAAAAVIFGVSGWLSGGTASHHPVRAELAADFTTQGHDVGRIEAYGKPLWWMVTVHGAGTTGPVTCEIVHRDGSITTMGTFDLVGGAGTWSTPASGGLAGATEAQLVDPDGQVLAVAHFS